VHHGAVRKQIRPRPHPQHGPHPDRRQGAPAPALLTAQGQITTAALGQQLGVVRGDVSLSPALQRSQYGEPDCVVQPHLRVYPLYLS
jgi:hypothetical protein